MSEAIDQVSQYVIILVIPRAFLCPVPSPPHSRHLHQTAGSTRQRCKAQLLA